MNILTNPIRYLLLSSMLLFSALASAELETIYYHNDHLGNPVAATSATGELMWQEEFTPYGTRQIKQDGGLNHIWYTGKELDADTGLVYFGARWYDPSIGQFLSVDPVGVIPGNRFSYNRYAYANNNPQKYIDPDGEFAQLIWGGLAGAAFDVALQGISITTGIQDEFSWGQLATSTLVGAGTGGLSVATKAVSIKRAVDASKAAKGITAKNGVKVDGFTGHGVDRAIGNGSDRAGVSPKGILDALKNPLKIGDVKTDKLGRQSQRFTGEIGEVVVNPQTSKVISVNPTSTKKAARLKRQLDNQ